MYAILDQGGRQVTVREGQTLRLDYREDVEPGQEITFDRVLMIGGEESRIGSPTVEGASVTGRVKQHVKGPKLRGIKRRSQDKSMTRWGHRQQYTMVEITKITV